MIDPADPRQLGLLLARHRIRARKRLGQNFLVDAAVRDRIVDAAGVAPDDDVLEVGAGAGTLTVKLAGRCRRLVAVELDARLAAVLRSVVPAGVEVLRADILRLELRSVFPEGGEIVVGNIPYYLTGSLVRRLLEPEPRPARLLLLVQKEVAHRWTSPGAWSLSTVAVQVFAEPRLVFEVPAGAFDPPPQVDSALVSLDVRPRPAVGVEDHADFFRLVEAVFQMRRKQLASSLGRVSGRGTEAAAALLRSIQVDPARRPETLSVAEWQAVYGALRSHG